MDEMTFDYGTGAAEHPFFYIPAFAFALLFCSTWIWHERCKKQQEILPRFAPLSSGSQKPAVLIDQNLTVVMDMKPPPRTPPPARHRVTAFSQSKATDAETV